MSEEQNGRTRSKTAIGQMMIKRSVSRDGRIDSLSVEITSPLDGLDADDLERRAREIVAGEERVAEVFLGKEKTDAAPKPNGNAVGTPAHMVAVGGMDTEWGRRLFVVFRVNGETARVFGPPRKLAGLLAAAGKPLEETAIGEGLELDVPCRVVAGRTPDGRYLSIEKVLPAST
ncbi:MAG TPA: hypothetical protein VFD92_15855 [Candidatus Binatia bacterium]|nr:hypothetical protein [Candidatus Binatia bacterium]